MEEWVQERLTSVNTQFMEPETYLEEQQAIQKYHIFKNFEAEVESYGHLADKIFKVSWSYLKMNKPVIAAILVNIQNSRVSRFVWIAINRLYSN